MQNETNTQAQATARELTFGEKAVGVTFNPAKNPNVDELKAKYASMIDSLNELRGMTKNNDIARMLSVAITETQSSCMWAVKAVTWQY